MSTASATYHKPQPALTPEVSREQPEPTLTATEIKQALIELEALGLVERQRDPRGVTRYRLMELAS